MYTVALNEYERCHLATRWLIRREVGVQSTRFEKSNTQSAAFETFHRLCNSHLEAIFLSCCREISNIGIGVLARDCLHLLNINQSGSSKFTDLDLLTLAREYPRLSTASVSNLDITDVGIVTLARGCYQLFFVDLAYCGH